MACVSGSLAEAGSSNIAGVSRRDVRGSNWIGSHSPRQPSQAEASLNKLVLRDEDGQPRQARSLRTAIHQHQSRDLGRRDCTGFTEERRYTTGGKTVTFGSTYDGPGSFELISTTSVNRTTNVSGTVGDPFGIVNKIAAFQTKEQSSKSLTYTLNLKEGQLGTGSWTPTLQCVEGTFTQCGGEADQHGNVCTPALSEDGTPKGLYRVVLQS
ncbi:hypothetical protein OC845_006043 [Tilletia horrida]|nr:hypothetical protein OC845_006043 [Tilletia horrida]